MVPGVAVVVIVAKLPSLTPLKHRFCRAQESSVGLALFSQTRPAPTHPLPLSTPPLNPRLPSISLPNQLCQSYHLWQAESLWLCKSLTESTNGAGSAADQRLRTRTWVRISIPPSLPPPIPHPPNPTLSPQSHGGDHSV